MQLKAKRIRKGFRFYTLTKETPTKSTLVKVKVSRHSSNYRK